MARKEYIGPWTQIALWDWNYEVKKTDPLIMIVWEGDEEDWLIHNQLIDPFYLTDDLIGVFEIKKEETLNPLTFKNQKGDFEMTLETGNF